MTTCRRGAPETRRSFVTEPPECCLDPMDGVSAAGSPNPFMYGPGREPTLAASCDRSARLR